MFTELTAEEARNLYGILYRVERDLKGRIAGLVTRHQTRGIVWRTIAYAGIVEEVTDLRDDLDSVMYP
jgi:hypothetical protein